MAITPDGDMVLEYAKSILRLHDELLSRLSSPEVHGHVVLGTPDLYAAYMLPSILSVFKEAFRGFRSSCDARFQRRRSIASSAAKSTSHLLRA